jgi:hypothetical protein
VSSNLVGSAIIINDLAIFSSASKMIGEALGKHAAQFQGRLGVQWLRASVKAQPVGAYQGFFRRALSSNLAGLAKSSLFALSLLLALTGH